MKRYYSLMLGLAFIALQVGIVEAQMNSGNSMQGGNSMDQGNSMQGGTGN